MADTCTLEGVRHHVEPCRVGCELCACFRREQCGGPPTRNLHGRRVVDGDACEVWECEEVLRGAVLRDRVRSRLLRAETLDRIDALFDRVAATILLEVAPELRGEIERRTAGDDLLGEYSRRLRGHVATTLEGLMRTWPRDRVELVCTDDVECHMPPARPAPFVWVLPELGRCAWDPCGDAARIASIGERGLEEATRFATANAMARLLPVSAGWLAPEIAAALGTERPRPWAVRRALAAWLDAPPVGYVIEPSEATPGWVRWRCEATGECGAFEHRRDALEEAWTHGEEGRSDDAG